jgi:hypothetical protein
VRGAIVFLARLLGRLGFGRSFFHVDAGCELRVSARVIDAAAGVALDSVEILLERPAEGMEPSPYQRRVGSTDATGNLDQTVLMRWSYRASDMTNPGPPPPPMASIARKSGYREMRLPFDVLRLTVRGSVRQLDLGVVSLIKI